MANKMKNWKIVFDEYDANNLEPAIEDALGVRRGTWRTIAAARSHVAFLTLWRAAAR